MTRPVPAIALLAPWILAACASTPGGAALQMTPPSGPKTPEFVAAGELRSSLGHSAAFDDWRVVGPLVNLARGADGAWDGTAGPAMTPLHLEARPGLLGGSHLSLAIRAMPDGFVELGGLLLDHRYLVRISPARITGHSSDGLCAFDFKRTSPALYVGDVACGLDVSPVSIEFLGTAARVEEPLVPQLALALIAVMPGAWGAPPSHASRWRQPWPEERGGAPYSSP